MKDIYQLFFIFEYHISLREKIQKSVRSSQRLHINHKKCVYKVPGNTLVKLHTLFLNEYSPQSPGSCHNRSYSWCATHPNLTSKDARKTVEALLEILKSSLEDGNDVLLSGFGKFKVKDKSARRGRNPQTGEELVLKPRRVVTFKPSGKLRGLVNEE